MQTSEDEVKFSIFQRFFFRCSIIVHITLRLTLLKDQTQLKAPKLPRTFMVHPETMDYVPNDAKFTSVQEIRHLRCFYQGHPGARYTRRIIGAALLAV